jgi:hypothetical protein
MSNVCWTEKDFESACQKLIGSVKAIIGCRTNTGYMVAYPVGEYWYVAELNAFLRLSYVNCIESFVDADGRESQKNARYARFNLTNLPQFAKTYTEQEAKVAIKSKENNNG